MGATHSFGHIDNETHVSGLGWPWPDHPAYLCYSEATSKCSSASNSEAAQSGGLSRNSLATSSQATAGLPRKQSVDAIVSQFETRHRLSRQVPRPVSRSATTPSPFVRNQLDSALGPRSSTFSEKPQRTLSSRSTIRADERGQIESSSKQKQPAGWSQSVVRSKSPPPGPAEPSLPRPSAVTQVASPVVKVWSTDHSVVIRIPEGVQLPLVATIQSSGNFETHMSGRLFWAGSAPEPRRFSEDADERPRSRAATIPETSEPASPTPERPLSLRSVRRGVLHVSEASIPAPQSSGVLAQGEVFFPDHTKTSGHNESTNWTPPQEEEEERAGSQTPTPDCDTSLENHPGSGYPTDRSEAVSTTGLEQLTPLDIPDIQIQAPSDTDSNMGTVLGTGVIKKPANGPKSPETVTNVAESPSDPTAGNDPASPATVKDVGERASTPTAGDAPTSKATATTAAENASTPTAGNNAPSPATATDLGENASAPTATTSGLPAAVPGAEVLPLAPTVDIPAPSQPDVNLTPVGVPPDSSPGPEVPLSGGRVPSRQRTVSVAKRMRKVILRRRVLDMLLGRELAGTVHPALTGAGGREE